MTENEISYRVIGAIYKVYNELGPGLLESIYEAALCYQLRKDGLKVENQVILPVVYDGKVLPIEFRQDVLVEDKVIVELKSVSDMKEVYGKQLFTYLKISHLKLGLLVNFNSSDIRSSIHRIVNHLQFTLDKFLSHADSHSYDIIKNIARKKNLRNLRNLRDLKTEICVPKNRKLRDF